MAMIQLTEDCNLRHLLLISLTPFIVSASFFLIVTMFRSISRAVSRVANHGETIPIERKTRKGFSLLKSIFIILNTLLFVLIEYACLEGKIRWLAFAFNTGILVLLMYINEVWIRESCVSIVSRFILGIIKCFGVFIRIIFTVIFFFIKPSRES